MLISAVKITDVEKKNILILYAQSLGCTAVYSEKYKGMCIETSTKMQKKLIKEKIKELK